MTAPTLHVDARLDCEPVPGPDPSSWFVTHGLGGPAAGTYTEVVIDDTRHPDAVVEEAVRLVAAGLYGDTYASVYHPMWYVTAIKRHDLWRREVVVVEAIEVWA